MANTFSAVCTATRDAEVKQIQGGEFLVLSVANNQGWGDKKTTMFIRVSYWMKSAQKLADFIKKGSQVDVSGELSQTEYNDKRYLELKATRVDLVGSKPQQDTAAPKQQDNFKDYEDEIPF
jgi:single-strand DNA-binding protein